MNAIQKAKEITKEANSDKEKATLIYNYITKHIQYDFKKAANVQVGYIPSIDSTLDTSLGMCFDYAVLYAAMMRSVDVPTKMVMGYTKIAPEYHAWNEVYLGDSDGWVTIDTTYDSPLIRKSIPTPMIKNSNNYRVEKKY